MAWLTRIVRLVVCACILQAGINGAVSAESGLVPKAGEHLAERPATFPTFWSRFRAAMLAGATDEVSKMTRFPLETRGTLDTDPVRYYSRTKLASLLSETLDADSGLSVSGPQTNRELIQEIVHPGSKRRGVAIGADSARVGPFLFARDAAGWRLVKVYTEPE